MKKYDLLDFYLFPDLSNDPALSGLVALADGQPCYKIIYQELMRFCSAQAVTQSCIAEYALRKLLSAMPIYAGDEEVDIYMKEDIDRLYERFFCTDWNNIVRLQGLLPFPSFCSSRCNFTKQFTTLIQEMVSAQSGAELYFKIKAFLSRYRNEAEAKYSAFLWDGQRLSGISSVHPIFFDQLSGLDHQKEALKRNTQAFLSGKSANNILLVGGAGTGKSSCVKACLNEFADADLKMVELKPHHLDTLPELMEMLSDMQCKYIIYLDDLSFEQADVGYLQLKNALDGQISVKANNILIYATSNRRHLVKEVWQDRNNEDIHENDTLHEKMSLAERFGIRLFFSVLSQEEYLDVVAAILSTYGYSLSDDIRKDAIRWAIRNNGRSGRTANQFVHNYLGQIDQ